MISSVSGLATPLKSVNRSAQPLARTGSAVVTAEQAAVRAIDQVTSNERTAIDISQRQEDRAAVDPQRPDIRSTGQDEAGDMAELLNRRTELRANGAVLRSYNRTVGTLLDVFG